MHNDHAPPVENPPAGNGTVNPVRVTFATMLAIVGVTTGDRAAAALVHVLDSSNRSARMVGVPPDAVSDTPVTLIGVEASPSSADGDIDVTAVIEWAMRC